MNFDNSLTTGKQSCINASWLDLPSLQSRKPPKGDARLQRTLNNIHPWNWREAIIICLWMWVFKWVRVPILNPVQCQSWQKWVCEPYTVWCIKFSSTSCDKGCWCIAYMGNIWHLDALWKEGKLGETVWCFGQCSVARQWGVFLNVPPTTALLLYSLS